MMTIGVSFLLDTQMTFRKVMNLVDGGQHGIITLVVKRQMKLFTVIAS